MYQCHVSYCINMYRALCAARCERILRAIIKKISPTILLSIDTNIDYIPVVKVLSTSM